MCLLSLNLVSKSFFFKKIVLLFHVMYFIKTEETAPPEILSYTTHLAVKEEDLYENIDEFSTTVSSLSLSKNH